MQLASSKMTRVKVRNFFNKPANIILVFFLVVLFFLTLYPLLTLLKETLTIHAGKEARAAKEAVGTISGYSYQKLLFSLKDEFSNSVFDSYSWI